MKRTLFIFTTIALLSALSGSVMAGTCWQYNNRVKMMGLHTDKGDDVFASVEGHDGGCGCNYFYFKEVNTSVDMILPVLTAAKLTNRQVRIDLLEEGDCYSAYRAYLQ